VYHFIGEVAPCNVADRFGLKEKAAGFHEPTASATNVWRVADCNKKAVSAGEASTAWWSA
ncbi:MAG: hypothetical protein M3328_01220, partial [Chloroflexota bacterium]|nr:hypothetical protein [Chloroflexota bacterium]